MGLARPRRPHSRAVDSSADHLGWGRQRRTHVEHHLDVGAQLLLHGHRALGGEPVGRAVVGRAEGDAVVVDLRREREDLVPAGICEEVAAPRHEAVETAETGDHVGTRAEHQVVGVGEDDLRAEVLEVGRRERAHGAPGADRHEAGRAKGASRRRDGARARLAVGGDDLDPKGHRVLPTSMASPKERKR